VGLAVGAVTSGAQTLLGGSALAGLANAVSPWVVAPFLLGATGSGRRSAAALGVLTCVAEVAGYYVTAALRGFGVGWAPVLLWVAAGLVAGIVFGLAGHSWRTTVGRERGLGAALLVAVWACEAVVTYVGHAVVFGAVAVLLLVLLGRSRGQLTAVLRWLVPAVGLGVAGLLGLQAL
jgi:hypothetical protein